MTDEECLQFLNKFKAIPWSKLKSKYNDIFVYLLNRFPDCDNVREAHYRLNHHILDLQEENKKLKELLNGVQL